jgi:hypothetical protein
MSHLSDTYFFWSMMTWLPFCESTVNFDGRISTLEIHFLFFMNEFREGTYTPLRGVSTLQIGFLFFYEKSICLKVLIPPGGVLDVQFVND